MRHKNYWRWLALFTLAFSICLCAGCATFTDTSKDPTPAELEAQMKKYEGTTIQLVAAVGKMEETRKGDTVTAPYIDKVLGVRSIQKGLAEFLKDNKAFLDVKTSESDPEVQLIIRGSNLEFSSSCPEIGHWWAISIATFGIYNLLGGGGNSYANMKWHVDIIVPVSASQQGMRRIDTIEVSTAYTVHATNYQLVPPDCADKMYESQYKRLYCELMARKDLLEKAVADIKRGKIDTPTAKPVITILELPGASVGADREKVTISFEVRSAATLKSVRVLVNGKEIFRREGSEVVVSEGTPWKSGDIEIPLAEGENKIEIMVEDVESRIARPEPETITVKRG